MSTPSFTVPEAYIVALPVQCVFFGLALATFILCVRALCAVPIRDFTHTRWALLGVSIATIIVGAVSIGQAMAHNMFAFLYYKGGSDPAGALNINQYPAVWIHSLTYPIQGFLGDSVLVYRTWVVNSYDWRFIAFPLVLVVGSNISAWGIVWSVGSRTSGTYLDPHVTPWTTAFIVQSIVLNVLCTGMIIWRILSLRGRSSGLQLVQRVVIESGFLYTLTSLLLLGTNVANSASIFIVADSYLQIIPICFNLIIIRTSNTREDFAGRYAPTRAASSSGGNAALSTLPAHITGFDRSVPFFGTTYDPEADKEAVPMHLRGRSLGAGDVDASSTAWSGGQDSKFSLSANV